MNERRVFPRSPDERRRLMEKLRARFCGTSLSPATVKIVEELEETRGGKFVQTLGLPTMEDWACRFFDVHRCPLVEELLKYEGATRDHFCPRCGAFKLGVRRKTESQRIETKSGFETKLVEVKIPVWGTVSGGAAGIILIEEALVSSEPKGITSSISCDCPAGLHGKSREFQEWTKNVLSGDTRCLDWRTDEIYLKTRIKSDRRNDA